jgi:hypothetical protein
MNNINVFKKIFPITSFVFRKFNIKNNWLISKGMVISHGK